MTEDIRNEEVKNEEKAGSGLSAAGCAGCQTCRQATIFWSEKMMTNLWELGGQTHE